MKVWIAERYHYREGNQIIGVYTTALEARTAALEDDKGDGHAISEHTVHGTAICPCYTESEAV